MSRRIVEVQPGFAQRRALVPAPIVAVLHKVAFTTSVRRMAKAAGVGPGSIEEALSGGRLTPTVIARLEAYVATLTAPPAPADEASP
jgi:hypothetical protein